jgi:hypothetical protein
MYRIRRNGQEPVVDVDTIEQIQPAIRAGKPGRWHIDEIAADPLSSRQTSSRFGFVIKQCDGSIVITPEPWEPSTGMR